ncbi:MAG TPA: retropepsin-like aspartic protease [Terracidiphilus sp.]|nr:retropepsin-like aspartic protease [Terracidiphilus sp.]
MSLFKCLLVASLLSQAAPAALGEAHCPGNVASLTLRLVQGTLIVVAVEANHSGPYDFLVDTGAQVSTIDVSLATELHLKPQSAVGVEGAATFSRRAAVSIDNLAAGDHTAVNSLAVVEDLAQLRAVDPRIRGILGGNFLQHFDMLIDNGHRFLCLDDSGALTAEVKGERIKLAEPYGTEKDLPFTRPIVFPARLSSLGKTPVLLRLDSGTNAPMLYANNASLHLVAANPSRVLKRTVSGLEQRFAVLRPQDVAIGKSALRQVSFTVPMNAIGNGRAQREDGLLPTIAYRRVFISCSGGFVSLDPW